MFLSRGFAEAPARVSRDAKLSQVVWGWLEAHWNVVSVIGGITVVVMLLATAALPPLLAPLVLGPLGAVVLTALFVPARKPAQTPDAPTSTEAQRRP